MCREVCTETLEDRVKLEREREDSIKLRMIKIAWPKILKNLQDRAPESEYRNFLYNLEPSILSEGKLWIGTERFFCKRVERIYGETIRTLIKELLHIEVFLEFYELD